MPAITHNRDSAWAHCALAYRPSTKYVLPGRLNVGLMAQELTGQELPFTQLGKPLPRTYQYAEKTLQSLLSRCGMSAPQGMEV